MIRAVTRKGDLDEVHRSVPVRAEGSPDVLVNGRPAGRKGDLNTVHRKRPKGTHSRPIASGSSTVFVNGRALARVGDPVSSCTRVETGSPDVFSG